MANSVGEQIPGSTSNRSKWSSPSSTTPSSTGPNNCSQKDRHRVKEVCEFCKCSVKAYDDANFVWLRRQCKGVELHVAILGGDYIWAQDTIVEHPELVESKFTYVVREQEGSGEALHLAASIGNNDMVELLLTNKANVHAMVTRGDLPHYNALHAACFANGEKIRKSHGTVVRSLLDRKIDPNDKNGDGKTSLHIAYERGAKELIQMLQGPDDQYHDINFDQFKQLTTVQASALEAGFKKGMLSLGDLADLAPLCEESLQQFLVYGPKCIPRFLERIHDLEAQEDNDFDWRVRMVDEFIKNHVDVKTVCELFQKSPDSAALLLKAAAGPPDATNEGHHPVPSRVNFFALRGSLDGESMIFSTLRRILNNNSRIGTYYKRDNKWSFNSTKMKSKKWHEPLTNIMPPTLDIQIKVCDIPGLVCAEIFQAIVDASGSGSAFGLNLKLFDYDVIEGLVEWMWWHAAWKFDLLQVSLNFFGLVQLSTGMFVKTANLHVDKQVGINFVGARGVVDIILEAVEFAGYARIGQWRAYCQSENFVNVLMNSPMVLLLFHPENLHLRAITILLYWLRLLGIFRCAEKIAMVLMPIQRSVYGVLPALVVTLIFFVGIVQAVSVFMVASMEESGDGDPKVVLAETVFALFGVLFAGEFPDEGEGDYSTQFLLYVGTLVFTIGLLNIFISVISESYIMEVEKAKWTFTRERACGCLTYLLRVRALPLTSLPFTFASALGVVSLAVLILPMFADHKPVDLFSPRHPYAVLTIFLALATLNLAALQNRHSPWPTAVTTNATQLKEKSIKELRTMLEKAGVDHSDCKTENDCIKLIKDKKLLKKHQQDHYLWLVLMDEDEQAGGQLAATRKIVADEVRKNNSKQLAEICKSVREEVRTCLTGTSASSPSDDQSASASASASFDVSEVRRRSSRSNTTTSVKSRPRSHSAASAISAKSRPRNHSQIHLIDDLPTGGNGQSAQVGERLEKLEAGEWFGSSESRLHGCLPPTLDLNRGASRATDYVWSEACPDPPPTSFTCSKVLCGQNISSKLN